MGSKSTYPRYFAYGPSYTPPAPYIKAINEHASFIVDPGSTQLHAYKEIEHWETRANGGMMSEVSRKEIGEAIEVWNQSHLAKLKLPE